MKAILMSIQPKWCELIASGKKTIEVRETAPKLETPFKVYVYCTKDKHYEIAPIQFIDGLFIKHISENTHWANGCTSNIGEILNGKVIGEFVCDKVEECIPDYNPVTQEFFYNEWEDSEATCLTSEEQSKYGKGKPLYGLHISELKIYDKPKELGEFRQACKIFSKRVCGLKTLCGEQKGICDGTKSLTRPPKGWQYVEEI